MSIGFDSAMRMERASFAVLTRLAPSALVGSAVGGSAGYIGATVYDKRHPKPKWTPYSSEAPPSKISNNVATVTPLSALAGIFGTIIGGRIAARALHVFAQRAVLNEIRSMRSAIAEPPAEFEAQAIATRELLDRNEERILGVRRDGYSNFVNFAEMGEARSGVELIGLARP